MVDIPPEKLLLPTITIHSADAESDDSLDVKMNTPPNKISNTTSKELISTDLPFKNPFNNDLGPFQKPGEPEDCIELEQFKQIPLLKKPKNKKDLNKTYQKTRNMWVERDKRNRVKGNTDHDKITLKQDIPLLLNEKKGYSNETFQKTRGKWVGLEKSGVKTSLGKGTKYKKRTAIIEKPTEFSRLMEFDPTPEKLHFNIQQPQVVEDECNEIDLGENPAFNEDKHFQPIIKPTVLEILKIEGYGVPLDDESLVQRILFVKNYLAVTKFMLVTLIPLGVLTAIIHDIITYNIYPLDNYGTTGSDIALGLSTNEQGWSSHLGSYNRGLHPLIWPAIFTLCPLLFPSIATAIWSLLPNTDASRLERDILWGDFVNNDRVNKLNDLIDAYSRGGIRGLSSLNSLINIANSFSQNDLERFINHPVIKLDLTAIKNLALDALPRKTKILGPYIRWKTGTHKSLFAYAFALPGILWGFFALYANGRYMEAFVHKAILLADYIKASKVCNAINKHYLWTDATANFECTACGDWPMVSYRDSLTVDGCLSILFAQPLPPETLSIYLKLLGNQRNVSKVDLSAQHWVTWSFTELAHVLDTLQALCKPGVTLVSFSQKEEIYQTSPAHLQLLAKFINHVQPAHLHMNGLQLTDENFQAWISTINSTNSISTLSLSNNPLGDEGIRLLAEQLAKFTQLTGFSIEHTKCSDVGLQQLADAMLNHSGITQLNVANNKFSTNGLSMLFTHWQDISLDDLNVSGNTLSASTAERLAKALKKRSLSRLIANHCLIDDECIMNLAEGFFSGELHLANNQITDAGLTYFLAITPINALQQLNIAFNQIGDDSLPVLGASLRNSTIHTLFLSGNRFTANGMNHFMPELLISQLHTLEMNSMALGDEIAINLAHYFKMQDITPLLFLSLDNNGITNEGAQALFAAKTNLLTLTLANNILDDEISEDIQQFIENNPQLASINLASNLFNNTLLKHLRIDTNASNLTQIDVSNNVLNTKSVLDFTKELLTPTPHRAMLGEPTLSLDERKALMKTEATTSLQRIYFGETVLDSRTDLALNQVNTAIGIQVIKANQHHTGNPYLLYSAPPTAKSPLSINSAVAIAGVALSPFGVSMLVGLGLAGGIIFLCLLYRGIEKSYNYCRSPSKSDTQPGL